MKKTVVRIRKPGQPVPAQRAGARPPPYSPPRPSPEPGGSSVPVIVAVVAVLVVLVVIVIAMSAGNPDEQSVRMTTAAQAPAAAPAAAPAEEPPAPKKWDELNGKTMAEWMKDNNGNNEALREREDRIRKYQAGPKK